MRLPFGLGRRSSSGDGASGGGASTGSPAPSPRPTVQPSRAWANLPPIQRATGDMPLVAAPGSFAGELPGSRALPPIVQPLGHEVSALATPGLVVAHARPVSVAAAGSIPPPVQRRAVRGGSRSAAAPAFASPAPEPELVEHVAQDAPVATAAPVPAVAPVRTMPTVSRTAVRVPDRPLTSAASAARPAAVQRAAAAAAATAGPSAAAPLPPPASGGMRRVPGAASATAPTVSRQASAPQAEPAASAAPAPVAKPSRAGLGEPLAALPASARPITAPGPVVSRSTTSGPMPIAAAALRPPGQRSASATPQPAAVPALGPGPTPGAAASAARLPELPHLPVARAAGPGGGSASASQTAVSTTVMRTPAPDAPPLIRPIAGANPIRTAFSLQRDAADDVEEGDEDEAGLPSPWWAPATESSGRAAVGDGAGASGLASAVQRSVAGGVSTTQAVAGGGRPAVQPSSGTRTSIQRAAASPRLPSLTLPRDSGHRVPDAGRSVGSSAATSSPLVQTGPTATSPAGARIVGAPGPGAVVQREGTVAIAAQEPAPPAAPGTSTSPAGPASPAGPVAPSGQGRSERDLDELAQALFGRIRGRLRSDLIYDREAKGLTFDNV